MGSFAHSSRNFSKGARVKALKDAAFVESKLLHEALPFRGDFSEPFGDVPLVSEEPETSFITNS